jgi:hypothetical protein
MCSSFLRALVAAATITLKREKQRERDAIRTTEN